MVYFIILIVLGILFLIFDLCMLSDQYTTIIHNSTLLDLKRKKFVEKRTIGEVLIEVFGDKFGIHWIFPIKNGGFYKYYTSSILKIEEIKEENQDHTHLKSNELKKDD